MKEEKSEQIDNDGFMPINEVSLKFWVPIDPVAFCRQMEVWTKLREYLISKFPDRGLV
jgi:hypothetical protein